MNDNTETKEATLVDNVKTPRPFGNVRQLPSGRFQARYRPLREKHIIAPHTFDTEEDARAWLQHTEAKAKAAS